MIRLWWAFLRRDHQVAWNYRVSAALGAAGGAMTLVVLYFLSKTMGPSSSFEGGSYFAFALVGVVFLTVFRSVQGGPGNAIRQAQMDGSLEIVWMTPRGTLTLISGLFVYPLLTAMLRAVILLGIGAGALGARLQVRWEAALLVLACALLAHAALGIFSAAYVMAFKRGDPFSFALDSAAYLFAGVLYPIGVLPGWMQPLAQMIPTTPALAALRSALLEHASVVQVLEPCIRLLLFAAVLWPLGVGTLFIARRHMERTGAIPHA